MIGLMRLPARVTVMCVVAALAVVRFIGVAVADSLVPPPTRIVECALLGPTCTPLGIDAAGRFMVYFVGALPPFPTNLFVHDALTNTERFVAALPSSPTVLSPRITDDGKYILYGSVALGGNAYETATG